MNNSKFKNDESGALLVFFALCVAAIFLIASLSFDLGRRASTQTELQSFADNVALAAAGELNGQPDAIPRAIQAANDLIRDNFTFGNGDRTLATSDDYVLTFYDALPDPAVDPLDSLWLAALDPAPEISSRVARFARVQVNSVDVDWVFARLLTIFTSDALPDEAVDAEATAGATTVTCDVAPVWFCLPENFGDADDEDAWQTIADGYGSTLMLRTGGGGNGGGNGNGNGNNGGGGAWVPGNFGWLDVREMIPAEALVDENGGNPCTGLSGTPLYNCLVGAEGSVTTCFANGDVAFLPGQRNGITPAILNSRFDMFNATAKAYQDDARFPSAAITTKKYAEGSTCANQSEDDILDATDFLPDDCFFGIGGDCRDFTNPVSGGTEARFGDGVWTNGRLNYVDTNYSRDFESLGRPIRRSDIGSVINGVTITAAEVEVLHSEAGNIGPVYHKDDPFRPDVYAANGTTLLAAPNPEHLQLPNGAWRYDYYQAEMALSYGDTANTATFSYDGTPGSGRVVSSELSTTGTNLLPQLIRNDNSTVNRQGSSVPTCSDNVSLDPGRRTIVAAAVDCSLDGPNGTINGRDTGFAETYVEVFIQSVVGGTTTNGDMTMYVELLDDVQAGGGNDSAKPGIFRTLVQLYR